ncbi:MAG: hypothetical protein OXN83_02155 [Oligoflexia bacterium]|nr:hypothetical protein [Oligoflexia bacterium]
MFSKIKKWIIPLSVLIAVFALGLLFGLNSWNKNLYVSWTPSTARDIATAESHQNLLNLSATVLTQKASSTLFAQHQVVEKEGLLSFYLGNILIPDSKTQEHRFICEVFPSVEFSFSSLGMSLSGEKGLMIVQSPCNMEDMDWIGPFWLPQEEMLSHPEKKSFQLEEKDTFIRFYNASIELTPSWLLNTVRFFDGEEEQEEFLIQLQPNQTPYFELKLLK